MFICTPNFSRSLDRGSRGRSLRRGRIVRSAANEETSRAAAKPLRRRRALVSSGGPARREAVPPATPGLPRSEQPLGKIVGAYVQA